MDYKFYTADVFTDKIFSGNPLAVLPDAQGLNGTQMQMIAKEFNLSETVFVLPAERPEHDYRLRIFTPCKELPFAGHPTIGTACVLAAKEPTCANKRNMIFEAGVGAIPITLRMQQPSYQCNPTHARNADDVSNRHPRWSAKCTVPQLPQPSPSATPLITRYEMAKVIGLSEADIVSEPAAWSCGVPFQCVQLRDPTTLARVQLQLNQWRALLMNAWAPQIYIFAIAEEDSDIRARMFAPSMGITEDPATGAAAAALVRSLLKIQRVPDGICQWRIQQGVEMGRPSLIEIEARVQAGQVVEIRIGGGAVIVSSGKIQV